MLWLGYLGYALGLGAFLIVIVLAVNAVVRGVIPPPGPSRGAVCGRCRYELTSVAGGRCPECGADLTVAGVLTRPLALRYAGSTAVAMVGWTGLSLLLGAAGIASLFVFGNAAPSAVTTYVITGQTVMSSAPPRRPGELVVSAQGFEVTRGLAASGTLSLGFVDNGGPVSDRLELDAATWTLTVYAPDGGVRAGELPLDEVTIQGWLDGTPWADASADTSPTTPILHSEDAARLRTAFDAAVRRPSYADPSWDFVLPGLNVTGGGTTQSPSAGSAVGIAGSLVGLVLIGSAVLWVLGLWFIARRRRRMFAAAEPPA